MATKKRGGRGGKSGPAKRGGRGAKPRVKPTPLGRALVTPGELTPRLAGTLSRTAETLAALGLRINGLPLTANQTAVLDDLRLALGAAGAPVVADDASMLAFLQLARPTATAAELNARLALYQAAIADWNQQQGVGTFFVP